MNRHFDVKLDFGAVAVGTEAVLCYEIKNPAKYPNWSIVIQEDFINTINSFSLRKKVTKTSDGEKHKIEIFFNPYRPYVLNVNFYIIKNAGEKEIILKVKGYSEGISVMASTKYLNFYRLQNCRKTKAVFELYNKSITSAMFQVANNNLFKTTPEMGYITAGQYVYITIEFKTDKVGVFFYPLVILINFHKPIYIEIVGVNSPKSTNPRLKAIRGQSSEASLESGFETYCSEYFGSITPICNITPKYSSFTLAKPIVTPELLNLSNKCLEIDWDTDDTVSIKPAKFHVRPNERCYFDVEFKGKIPEQLYGGCVHGRAFINGGIKDQESPQTTILPILFRYIGSTFCKTKHWTPTFELHPHVVVMPPCLQNDFVYSTFYIQKLGSYPVSFEIFPPTRQPHFFVKPLNGLIRGDFKIFVVKLNPGDLNEVSFIETWKIRLNQNPKVEMDITFKAFVQNPKLLIGENNEIDFGRIFPGCKQMLTVPLINETQNKIEFSFPKNKWFDVRPSEGIVDSYGVVYLTWIYTADFDVKEENILKYKMRIVHGKRLLSGEPYIGSVKLFAKNAYGRFCSSPTKHNFETVTCGTPTKTSFTMYNLSEVTLHFALTCHEHYGVSEPRAVALAPQRGSVAPGAHVLVQVVVLTYVTGLSSHCVQYQLRESECGEALADKKGSMFTTSGVIFRIDYYSFYPTLKVIEIGRNVSGPLFGKLNVWEYFNIDELNNLLRNLKINETVSYRIQLPAAEAKLKISKSVTLIVKNVTREDTTCHVARKKICSCESKELPNASSFRTYTYEDCPHRKLITITTSSEVIKAYQTMLLKIETNYLLYGKSEACYVMKLSHNRTVELYFTVIGLKSRELSTYAQGFTLTMKSVFIGERYPDLQTYWFLNNTRAESFYRLDLEPLNNFNKHWGHNVLTCLNAMDIVPPKNFYVIQFLYAPIAVGRVKIKLPFTFGNKKETLTSMALPIYTSPLEHVYYSEIGRETVKLHDLYVNLSMEHIVIRALPTHCSTRRIFVIKNVNKSKTTVAFSFDCYQQKNIVTGYITPNSGILKSGESCAVILHVHSGGVSTTMRLCFACHLVDYNMLKMYLNSMAEYHNQTDQRGDFFSIGTGGVTSYPKKPTVHISRAPRIYHRTMSLTCNIVNHTDIDTKMSLHNQLKQTPFASISLYDPSRTKEYLIPRKIQQAETPIRPIQITQEERNKRKRRKELTARNCMDNKCCSTFTSEEFVLIHTVLSCLLHDFISSEKFKRSVQVQTERNEQVDRSYSEMKTEYLTPEEEKQQVDRVINKIPNVLLANTMQSLLADCVLGHFKFGQYPYNFNFNKEELFSKKHTEGKNIYTEKFSFLMDLM